MSCVATTGLSSNLMITSKLCERVVYMQVNDHLNANELVDIFQSAYKVGHSTESALLRAENDILRSSWKRV